MAKTNKFWLVGADMGYGHQRTAFPLKDFAFKRMVVNANNYQGIPWKDKKVWAIARTSYELVSRAKKIPLFGGFVFRVFDRTQRIHKFYPKTDLSRPNFGIRQNFLFIKALKWGRHLIQKLGKHPLPMLNTFFVPAFMAEIFDYPGDIFCIICDADISRTWASLNSRTSRIKYFAPTERVVERLKLYGVRPQNIFLTGYPLPLENIGTRNLNVLRRDLANRLVNLDPQKKYLKQYEPLIRKYIGRTPRQANHILTIMFAVGGAGLQKEIGMEIVESLREDIEQGNIRIVLSAGIRKGVKDYFNKRIRDLGLGACLARKNIDILFCRNIQDYFRGFNKALKTTDILYTKPSELSFYAGLGIPIIMCPCVGSQEEFNKEWLVKIGAGIDQENPRYAKQWIFDLLDSGWFARAAMQGFLRAEKLGSYNIKQIICSG